MTFPLRIRLALATGLGVGYVPRAPGTAGSLVGLFLAWALRGVGGDPALLVGLLVVTALGLWSAGAAEVHWGRRDPAPVVVDEIAGQMLALLFLAPGAAGLVSGFLLFRLFDIAKPFPLRRLERLSGGSGIMADDLMAGVYANLVQQVLLRSFPDLWGGA